MSRTKQTASKSTEGMPPRLPVQEAEGMERSKLLQLLGLPSKGKASAVTATADWQAVVESLSTNPEEAATTDPRFSSDLPEFHPRFRNQTAPFDYIEAQPPERPLSAYNIFFKEERQRILENIPEEEDQKAGAAASGDANTRKHEKPPQDFQSLARLICRRWKELTPEKVEYYKKKAEEDMRRYRYQMMKYLAEKDHWNSIEKYPFFVALANQQTPIPKEAVVAFIKAYPDLVTKPRSKAVLAASKNAVLCSMHPEIIDTLVEANSHTCGLERTRTFQLMGFPASIQSREAFPQRNNNRRVGATVDWEALEAHLREHPEEAKVLCPTGWHKASILYPLEAALHFENHPPLSTIQLLLQLCPEAVTIADSCALTMVCALQQLQDPEMVRTILSANPSQAAIAGRQCCECGAHCNNKMFGIPLHTAAYFLPCADQVVPMLVQAYPEGLSCNTTTIHNQIPLQVATSKHNSLPTNLLRVLLEHGHRYKVGADVGGQLVVHDGDEEWCAMNTLIETAGMWREEWESGGFCHPWQNLCLGLKAAGAFKANMSVETMWDYPLLHAAIEFSKRQYIVELILERHSAPADLSRVDALGRTPLVVAIEMASSNFHHDPDEVEFEVILELLLDDDKHGSSQVASLPVHNTQHGAAAASTLPLHLALHKGVGMADGAKHIVMAFPGALSIPDPQTKLLPCLLAAVGEQSRVETIFGLMILRPNLIATLCRLNSGVE